LVQKLIALKFKQKVLIFRKIYTPKFLGCYKAILGFHRREAILGFRLAAVSSPHPPPHPRVPPSGGGPRFLASR
jgi:hypothetical protein